MPDMTDQHVGSDGEALANAYEQRTAQVHEARGALAQAVSALTAELSRRNDEHDRAVAELGALRERIEQVERELRAAQADVAALQSMKVVRWTAVPRRIVYRMRSRSG
jgi:chromosome segregation ATPase